MPRHEVAVNGGKLTDLQSKAAIFPRCHAECVFIEADRGTVIARIEATIESRLCKEINRRSELGVEKHRQARAEQIVDLAVDESWCWLLEVITFEIDCAAQSCPSAISKRGESECAVEPVKKFFDLKGG